VTPRLDPARFRELRDAAGVTKRALARTTNTTATFITSLEEAGDLTHVPYGVVDAIARALGVTIGELVDSRADADAVPDPDAITREIVSLLHRRPEGTHINTIAAAGRLSLDELEEELRGVSSLVREAGLRLVRADNVVRLASSAARLLTDDAVAAAERADGTRRAVTRREIDIMRQVTVGSATLKQLSSSGDGHIRVGSLRRAGLIRVTDTNEVAASEEVRFSLLLDE
jgi:transcriptional regulator with XRE-family HTH domain